MSARNTPINAKMKSISGREVTPRNVLKSNMQPTSSSKLKKTINFDESDDMARYLNTAFSLPVTNTSSASKYSASKMANVKIKSKSTTTLNMNACHTPSSLHRTANNVTGLKTFPITPKSNVPVKRIMTSSQQNTPECFTKVSLETPIRRLRRSNTTSDLTTITGNDENHQQNKDSTGGEISNLKVAVRVRPMNAKELLVPLVANIVQVDGNEVTVLAGTTADSSAGVSHCFQYDHAFWSCNSKHGNYANQKDVFDGTARPLVDKAFEGYNTCLFAYGQTGSGKSYSMMGIDGDDNEIIGANSEAGIIPRFCQELFTRIEAIKATTHAEVEISYFEIYNEKIHDLLAISATDGLMNTINHPGRKSALRVREHPVWGPYVVDLSTHPVDSYTGLRNWLAVGNSQRATAATGMNDKSSRSHSIFNIVLNLSESNIIAGRDGEEIVQQTKRSKISLVDLAGSERISLTCASGERLREGVSINKSLLTLGKVIAALADAKRGPTSFVPYRESVLTWLLRENLGGNSRTVMLATISPASMHLDETMSTLRYACQARTIINRVKVNEDPQDRIIRELRAEVERLQALQQDYDRQKRHSLTTNGPPRKIIIETSVDESEIDALRQQLVESEQELAKAQRSWMDRLREAEDNRKTELKMLRRKGLALELSVEQKQPCLVNLAADPILSGTLLYILPPGLVKIGRSRPSAFPQPDIVLDGPLVSFNHCSIENNNSRLFINPSDNAELETFINGELINERRQLFHGDRLVIGGSHYFRVSNPKCSNRIKQGQGIVDYQSAHQEILLEQEKRLRQELDAEKQAALELIQAEREANELKYAEKLANLEIEKFKYKCSNELLENEVKVYKEQAETPISEYKPYRSTLLDDIQKLMAHPTKESLHQTQLKVKEATQRCRDLNVDYEFKQTQIVDEFGIFRAVVNIIDRKNKQMAEWPPARLDVWLDIVRENDVTASKLFDCVEIEWKYVDDVEPSFLNDSFNSSRRISLNLSAVKDVILGRGNEPKNKNISFSSPQNTRQEMIKSALRNSSSKKNQNNVKKMLFSELDTSNENSPIICNANHNNDQSRIPSKSPKSKDFDSQANSLLKEMQSATLRLKKLCNRHIDSDNKDKQLTTVVLRSADQIQEIIQDLHLMMTEKDLKCDNSKTPKSMKFYKESIVDV